MINVLLCVYGNMKNVVLFSILIIVNIDIAAYSKKSGEHTGLLKLDQC